MNVDFITVVWGKDFLSRYTQASLPSQLSRNNRHILSLTGCRYLVYTDQEGVDWIQQSAAYRTALSHGIKVEFRDLEHPGVGIDNVLKYRAISDIHSQCLQECRDAGRYFSWLIPDGVYPDGFFQALKSAIDGGVKVILGPGIRVNGDQFQQALTLDHTDISDEQETAEHDYDTSCLVELVLNHLHPITKALFVGTRPSSTFPSCVYFAGRKGLIAKHFHLHPLLFFPAGEKVADISGTIDSAGYFEQLDLEEADFLIPRHTDECLWIVELSPPEHQLSLSVEDAPLDALKLAKWAHRNASQMQSRLFFKRNFVFSAGGASLEKERRAAETLFSTVDQILLHASPLIDEIELLRVQLKNNRGQANTQLFETRKLRDLFKEQRDNYRQQKEAMSTKVEALEAYRSAQLKKVAALRLCETEQLTLKKKNEDLLHKINFLEARNAEVSAKFRRLRPFLRLLNMFPTRKRK